MVNQDAVWELLDDATANADEERTDAQLEQVRIDAQYFLEYYDETYVKQQPDWLEWKADYERNLL